MSTTLKVLCWVTGYTGCGLFSVFICGIAYKLHKVKYGPTKEDFFLWPISLLISIHGFTKNLFQFKYFNPINFFGRYLPNLIFDYIEKCKNKKFFDSISKVNKKYGQ